MMGVIARGVLSATAAVMAAVVAPAAVAPVLVGQPARGPGGRRGGGPAPVDVERVTGLVSDNIPDQSCVPTVVRDGARYRAWYVSRFGPTGYAVHHAESTDGKGFTNVAVCFTGNRAPCRISGRPVVFKARGGWRMLLTVYHAVQPGRDAIVQLESDDGLLWGSGTVVAKGSDDCRRPAVVQSGREWWLFYERLERDAEPARSRYYRAESQDGTTWRNERSLFRDTTRAAASAAATLEAWYDRSARRWCLLSSEPVGGGRHRLVLRLSEDGLRWQENSGIDVTLGRDPRAAAEVDTHSFLEWGGRTTMYWGTQPNRLWCEPVDLGRLVREAVGRP